MPSPYVEREAEKLGISSKADYRREDYIPNRQRADREWRELQPIQPPESWVSIILNVAIAVLGGVLVWWLLEVAAPHLVAWRIALVSW